MPGEEQGEGLSACAKAVDAVGGGAAPAAERRRARRPPPLRTRRRRRSCCVRCARAKSCSCCGRPVAAMSASCAAAFQPAGAGILRCLACPGTHRCRRPARRCFAICRTIMRQSLRAVDVAHRRDRRRPRRPLLRLSLEAAASRRPDRPVRTERRRRHLGIWRGRSPNRRSNSCAPTIPKRSRPSHPGWRAGTTSPSTCAAKRVEIDGVGFSSIGRLDLLTILQQRVGAVGVTPHYSTTIQSVGRVRPATT